uniref:Inner membrane protein n=1 Tax=Syphacia muris TaxID=451379 RepID=A0A0N5ATN8_9BILA
MKSFCVFYSRLLAFWISLSIAVLVLVLLSQPNAGLPILVFTLIWMIVFFAGTIGVLIIRKQILVGLRHCVQSANKFLVKSDILAGVDDRGVLSCHKVVIIFMFLRTAECLPDVERLIRQQNLTANPAPKPLNHKEIQEYAEFLILKYSNNFVKDTTKKKLNFPTRPLEGVSEFSPKHCQTSYCLCQYIEKHFKRPPRVWYDRIV